VSDGQSEVAREQAAEQPAKRELPAEYVRLQEAERSAGPLAEQVGGGHYKAMPIQPVEFCQKNRLGYCEANIVKYACRHRGKGKAEDVRKIIHYAQLLLQLEYEEK